MKVLHHGRQSNLGRAVAQRLQDGPREGAALVFAIIVIGTIAVLSAVLVQSVVQRRFAVERRARRLQAECLAHSAMAAAQKRLALDSAAPLENWRVTLADLDNSIGSVALRIEDVNHAGDRYLVVTARVPAEGLERSQVTLRSKLTQAVEVTLLGSDVSDVVGDRLPASGR